MSDMFFRNLKARHQTAGKKGQSCLLFQCRYLEIAGIAEASQEISGVHSFFARKLQFENIDIPAVYGYRQIFLRIGNDSSGSKVVFATRLAARYILSV